MADDNVALDIRNVRAGYGDIEVLREVTAQIPLEKIFSIIGANGAGKSTLLKTIFGIVRATDGEIYSSGQDVARLSSFDILKLGIAYVPQGRSNFPAMTIQENLEMGAFTRSDDGVAADVEAMCERFPILQEKRRDFAGNLSGGQQQILEMGIALMVNPRVLLIDEPTLGLSPSMVESVFDAIKEINAAGTTIVMVEQNAKRALEISDFGLVLDLGKVRFEGTGQELLHNPDVRTHYLGM